MAQDLPIWPDRAVGSVLPLAIPDPGPRVDPSIWDRWVGDRSACAYQTARSALAEFLRARSIRRILLPAYACASLSDAARAAGCETEFFAVGDSLQIDVGDLSARLRGGEAVLAIDYFGRPPEAAFTEFAAARRDVLWIEDRAQALDPGAPAWGDAILYSPRKLIGVADGGVLVAAGDLPQPEPADPAAAALWVAQLARLEDPDGSQSASWFAASQAREAGFQVGRAAMSRLTRRLLEALPIDAEAEARRRNYAILASHLSDHSLWPDIMQPSFAPLAYPVLADDCEDVQARLAKQRIFCARHWAVIASPADAFATAHRLASRCLSIPCEPRYGPAEMHRVGEAVLDALRGRT